MFARSCVASPGRVGQMPTISGVDGGADELGGRAIRDHYASPPAPRDGILTFTMILLAQSQETNIVVVPQMEGVTTALVARGRYGRGDDCRPNDTPSFWRSAQCFRAASPV